MEELTPEEIEGLKKLEAPEPKKEKIDVDLLPLAKKIYLLQQYVPAMGKDKKGFGYQYFDINQMINAIKPLIKRLDMFILQPLDNIDGKPAIRTIIGDTNSQMEWVTPLPTSTTKQQGSNKIGNYVTEFVDPQSLGIATTYTRRYALQSLLFLEAEDNDGR